MERCELCRTETVDLARISGVAFCADCRVADPAAHLAGHDIAVEWDTRLMRFNAGVGIAGQDPELSLRCTPELWYHQPWKLVSQDLEVGDPAFDARIFVSTTQPARARQILAIEGVRWALMVLLSNVRVNDLGGNHVTLTGPTLLVSTRPLGGVDRIQELKLETAALALHLRSYRGDGM